MYFSTVWRLLRTNLINIRAMEWKWFCGTSFDVNLSSNVLSVRIYYVHYFARISGSDYLDLISSTFYTATGFQCTNNDNLWNCSYSTATPCIFFFFFVRLRLFIKHLKDHYSLGSYLPDPGVPGVRSMAQYGSRCLSQTFLKLCWCDSSWWWYQLNTSWWCQ